MLGEEEIHDEDPEPYPRRRGGAFSKAPSAPPSPPSSSPLPPSPPPSPPLNANAPDAISAADRLRPPSVRPLANAVLLSRPSNGVVAGSGPACQDRGPEPSRLPAPPNGGDAGGARAHGHGGGGGGGSRAWSAEQKHAAADTIAYFAQRKKGVELASEEARERRAARLLSAYARRHVQRKIRQQRTTLRGRLTLLWPAAGSRRSARRLSPTGSLGASPRAEPSSWPRLV